MSRTLTDARAVVILIVALVVTAGLFIGASAAPWTATFDGTPASPQSFQNMSWDIQVHSRDENTWFQLDPMQADHGSNCSAPPATHTVTDYDDAVFICNNHIMTALRADGYGVIYLTPNQVFDFANGGSITFELSTEVATFRDWWDITISPWKDNLAVPLLSDGSVGTDLNGYARDAIQVSIDNGESAPRLKLVKDGVQTCPAQCGFTPSLADGIPSTVNQAATRQTFKFSIANGRMKFERLASATAPALVYWDNAAVPSFTSGVVQFGHHSYNPTKDGRPGTWHWDNIQFSSANPFTMVKADRRYSEGGVVNFNSPAPANAYLRFAGICRVAIDGQVATRVPTYGDTYHADHFTSYFVPIAQGKSSVNFSFSHEPGHSGGCMAKDISIWSP